MLVITKAELLEKKREFLERMENEIFIYPTDTIYGIGCDATNVELVKKLRIIKNRFEGPFSIIAPGKKWIYNNLEVGKHAEEELNKLPGPFTLIFNLDNKEAVSEDTNNDMNTLGVRIPDHWISDLVADSGKPIITTSANIAGQDFLTKPEDVGSHLKNNVSFLIDEGEISGKPSKIIDCTKEDKEILRH